MEIKRPNLFVTKFGRTLTKIGICLSVLTAAIVCIGFLAIVFSFVIIIFAIVFTLGLILLDENFVSKMQTQNDITNSLLSLNNALPYVIAGAFICLIVGALLKRRNPLYRIYRSLGFCLVVQAEGGKVKYDSGNITVFLDETADSTKIRVKSFFELDRPLWFFYVVFFWLMGFFGLLTARYERLFPDIDCEFEMKTDGSSEKTPRVGITCQNPTKTGANLVLRAVNCKVISDSPELVKSDDVARYTKKVITNQTIRRRTRLVKTFSRLLSIAIIAALIIIIF